VPEPARPRILDPAQADRKWPEGLDVLILPGVGGGPVYGDAFAPAAWEVEEALVERGASVAYFGGDPDRVIVLKSADWWGPVLRVTEEIITGVAGAALYDAIKTLVGRRRSRGDPSAPVALTVHIAVQVVSEHAPSSGKTTVIGDEADVALAKLRELLEIEEG
jgi:hypothetical protein